MKLLASSWITLLTCHISSGDCHLTSWSPWSVCQLLCLDGRSFEMLGHQARSRAVIVQVPENKASCPSQVYETRPCQREWLVVSARLGNYQDGIMLDARNFWIAMKLTLIHIHWIVYTYWHFCMCVHVQEEPASVMNGSQATGKKIREQCGVSALMGLMSLVEMLFAYYWSISYSESVS